MQISQGTVCKTEHDTYVECRCQDPEEECESNGDVSFSPPCELCLVALHPFDAFKKIHTWCRERTSNIRNLGPVEGDKRHAHTRRVPEHLVDFL